jgi:hypothetical protein
MDSSDLSLKVFVGEFPAWNTNRLDELLELMFKGTAPGKEILD